MEVFVVKSAGDAKPPTPPIIRSTAPANPAPSTGSTGRRRARKSEIMKVTPLLELERILGLTSSSSACIATAPALDLLAYAAGSVTVLYNHRKNKQIRFLNADSSVSITCPSPAQNGTWSSSSGVSPLNRMNEPGSSNNTPNTTSSKNPANQRPKPIVSLAFSPDGEYLAVGETGHQPRILVWEVKTGNLMMEMRGHKYGVLALAFSPQSKFLISLGYQHDGFLNVWNWRTGQTVACNRVTSKVNAISFSRDGTYFVTAGLRHFKYWYLDSKKNSTNAPKSQTQSRQILDGRNGILGDFKNHNYVDVACCKISDNAYCVTADGILCLLNEERSMDKWVDLQVTTAYSIDVSNQYVVCACSDGIIRLFEPVTLVYRGTLPKPHPLGIDITKQFGESYPSSRQDDIYPDTIATCLDDSIGKVFAIYSDRSLFIWDINDISKIRKYRSFLFHSECVWGVEMLPIHDSPQSSRSSNHRRLPMVGNFVSYSADGTARFWNIDSLNPKDPNSNVEANVKSTSAENNQNKSSNSALRRNIYSKEMVNMLFIDPESAEGMRRKENEFLDQNTSITGPDYGIRALRISSDGKLMATGDRAGNLRVHNLETFELITYQEAHDAEIMTIDFTRPRREEEPYYIATASRDRLLHVFDIRQNYRLLQTMDDHSSSITAVKFSDDGSRLVSCGADKSIIFRCFLENEDPPYATYHNSSGRATVFDMDMSNLHRYIATVSSDRRFNLFSIDSGKPVKTYKPDTVDELSNGVEGGSLIRISLDPSGTFAVACSSDKSIRLFDIRTGHCLTRVMGHSELVTCVKFSQDCSRVISTSSDGCIFIWRLRPEFVRKIQQRIAERSEGERRSMSPQLGSAENESIECDSSSKKDPINQHKQVRRTSSIVLRKAPRTSLTSLSPTERKNDDLYNRLSSSVSATTSTSTTTQRKRSGSASEGGKITSSPQTISHHSNVRRSRESLAPEDRRQRRTSMPPSRGKEDPTVSDRGEGGGPVKRGGVMAPTKSWKQKTADNQPFSISRRAPAESTKVPNDVDSLYAPSVTTPNTSPAVDTQREPLFSESVNRSCDEEHQGASLETDTEQRDCVYQQDPMTSPAETRSSSMPEEQQYTSQNVKPPSRTSGSEGDSEDNELTASEYSLEDDGDESDSDGVDDVLLEDALALDLTGQFPVTPLPRRSVVRRFSKQLEDGDSLPGQNDEDKDEDNDGETTPCGDRTSDDEDEGSLVDKSKHSRLGKSSHRFSRLLQEDDDNEDISKKLELYLQQPHEYRTTTPAHSVSATPRPPSSSSTATDQHTPGSASTPGLSDSAKKRLSFSSMFYLSSEEEPKNGLKKYSVPFSIRLAEAAEEHRTTVGQHLPTSPLPEEESVFHSPTPNPAAAKPDQLIDGGFGHKTFIKTGNRKRELGLAEKESARRRLASIGLLPPTPKHSSIKRDEDGQGSKQETSTARTQKELKPIEKKEEKNEDGSSEIPQEAVEERLKTTAGENKIDPVESAERDTAKENIIDVLEAKLEEVASLVEDTLSNYTSLLSTRPDAISRVENRLSEIVEKIRYRATIPSKSASVTDTASPENPIIHAMLESYSEQLLRLVSDKLEKVGNN
ncbi:uncharacterized protein VTP21DRAFT_1269 [Calcarisporiella thermophila]|uniref:uncharacterized protein n=1 Tax=Calcarisporiella thermophila TaxID=911321 RepID=UPI0037445909